MSCICAGGKQCDLWHYSVPFINICIDSLLWNGQKRIDKSSVEYKNKQSTSVGKGQTQTNVRATFLLVLIYNKKHPVFLLFLNVPFSSFVFELLSAGVSGLYQIYTLLAVTAVLNDSFLGFGSQTRRCYKKKIQVFTTLSDKAFLHDNFVLIRICCIIEVVVFIPSYFHVVELLLHAEEICESACRNS